ncbi:MAG TPA: hypothetical protein VFL60_01640 [Gaiellaceae bacterium]|nr:hypothetical protein [Gaiellaceae bacterium]
MHKLLTNLIKRKTLFALVLALTIFGAVYGFAATLNVGANQLSAGNATVASCQSATATGTYQVGYDATNKAYGITAVVVTGLDAACQGKPVSVTLTGNSGGTNLATLPVANVPTGGGSLTLTPSGFVSAASVTGVSVAING